MSQLRPLSTMPANMLRNTFNMLRRTTATFANHGMPLKCDIYTAEDYSRDAPVLLYFHPGGLVSGSRRCVPPWLVQVCYKRKWPLISASYRLLPQVGAKGLLKDVAAAYDFALKWEAPEEQQRRVIVTGASGGFAAAVLTAHHLQPPFALFSLMGINTFQHPFYRSSIQLGPKDITDAQMAHVIAGPVAFGETDDWNPRVFNLDKLLPDGSRNPEYKVPQPPSPAQEEPVGTRNDLYEYYLSRNAFPDLVAEVDLGYEWARDPANKARVEKWPPTVIIHGDSDTLVPLNVSEKMRECLGADKVQIVVAGGQDHLYEAINFIEDESPGMDAVTKAVGLVDDIARKP